MAEGESENIVLFRDGQEPELVGAKELREVMLKAERQSDRRQLLEEATADGYVRRIGRILRVRNSRSQRSPRTARSS